MEINELKRKLRQLKKLEARIRFKDFGETQKKTYIWNEYFSTKDSDDDSVKYNMSILQKMNHEGLKEVFGEYFYHVYAQFYKENGMVSDGMFDAGLLVELGVSPNASIEMIKSRFRELAKAYHPDRGGDGEKFIELVEIYNKVIGRK